MKKSKYLLLSLMVALTVGLTSCSDEYEHVVISTEYGDMEAILYNSTPGHRDNFLKLVEESYYDSLLFHRVMEGFMIQGGDPDSKTAAPGSLLGMGGPGYTIPAEIGAPHFKGTLAAARTPDAGNPEFRSSGSQFYIVQGRPVTDQILDQIQMAKGVTYNDAQRQLYKEIGGTPQLDGSYTVFGEIIKGLEVIDEIAAVTVDQSNRPVQNIRMTIKKK